MFSITQLLRLPLICILCNQFYKGKLPVCKDCMGLFTPMAFCCSQCAYPLPDKEFSICGLCIKNPPHFDQAFIAYAFEEPLRGLLHQFKYQQAFYLTSFLKELMLYSLERQKVNLKAPCLIPIPMHAKRLKQRGFNQAALLAKALAKHLKLPCDLKSCKKIIHTLPQASLDKKQRKVNLVNSFCVKKMPAYEHVVLIDDLLTTGNTANELAKTMKKAGVKQVDIWCCARAVMK